MIPGTHNFSIGLLIVSQLPLHLLTNTLYGENDASPTPSFTASILGLGIHFLLITDTHSNALVLIILNKLTVKPINHIFIRSKELSFAVRAVNLWTNIMFSH